MRASLSKGFDEGLALLDLLPQPGHTLFQLGDGHLLVANDPPQPLDALVAFVNHTIACGELAHQKRDAAFLLPHTQTQSHRACGPQLSKHHEAPRPVHFLVTPVAGQSVDEGLDPGICVIAVVECDVGPVQEVPLEMEEGRA